MNCKHQWIANSGSNDKPCKFCLRYPVLKLRYWCNLCVSESCRFCLIDREQLPPENSTFSEIRPNRHQTLELRIIKQNNTIIQMMVQMYNKIDQIEKRIKLLEEEKESENKINKLIYKINPLTLDDNIRKLKTPDKEMIFGTI